MTNTMSIEQRQNLKDELNQAIYTVITTKYKKDAKEAHEMVSAFGYTISKWEGRYRVTSKETSKSVYLLSSNYYKRRFDLGNNVAEQVKREGQFTFEPCRIDFVNYLNKPFNRVYYEMRNNRRYHSRAVSKYGELRDIKWDIKYYGDKMNELKGQIARLEDEMISYSRRQVLAEEKLRRTKHEFHLI